MKVKKWKMKKNAALALAVILMTTGMNFPVYAEETNTAENQVVAENQEATVSPGDGESNEIMMTSLVAEEIHTIAPGEIKEIDGRQYTAGADGARVAWAYDDELYLGCFVSVLDGEVETGLDASESLCIAYPDGEGGYTNLEKLTIDADGARGFVLGEERNCISMKAGDVLTREEVYDYEEMVVGKYEYFPGQDMESSVRLIFREGKVTIDPDSLWGGVSLDGYLKVTAPKGTTDVLEGIDLSDWDDGYGSATAVFGVDGDMILEEGVIVLRSDNSPAIRIREVATNGITVSGNDMGVNALIQKDDSVAAGLVDGTALISMGPAREDSFAMYGDPGEPILVMSDGTVQPASQFSYDENGIYVAYGVFEHVSGNPEITLYIENDSTPAVTIGNNTEFVAYNIQNRGYIMGSGTLTCDEGISTYVIDGEAYKVTGVTMTGNAAFTEEDGVLVAADKSVVSVVSKDDGEKTCTVKVEPDPNPYVIYVGGVGMRNGEYLANGATSSSSSKPASGGYAYIKDNTLTLNNYSYAGPGYLYEPFYDEEEGAYYNYTAALYSDYEAVLNVILEGENSLANTDSLENNCLGDGMAAKGGLNIGGSGSLTIDSSEDGICTDGDITIRGNSTLEICDAQYGVYANKVAISDSTVLVTADDRAFVVYDSFDIAAGLSVLLPDGGVCGLYEEVVPAFQTIMYEDGSPAASVLIAAECDHEYSDYYVYNDTYHWKTCTKDCILTRYPEALAEGYAEHDFDDATGKCICGYEADRDNDLYVGGVGMITGEYLSNEGFICTVKPSGGYAYYKDGTLTLNNYAYSGAGYVYNADDEYMSALYSEKDLKIQLEGTNSLKNTSEYCDGITVYNAELTLDGDGTMEIDADYAIYTYGERDNEDNYVGTDRLIINGGTWNITSDQMAISTDGSVVMTGGTVSADSQWLGISVFEKDFLISGGSLTVNGDEVAVQAAKGITIGEGSKLLAPADGKIVYEEKFEDFTGYTIYEADGTTKATHVEIGKAPVEETPEDGDKEDTPGSEGGKGEAIPEPDDDADSDDSSDSEENVNAPAAPVVTPVAPAPAPAQKEQKPAGNEPQQPATGTQQPATGTQSGTETDTTDTGVTETAEEMPFIKGAEGKEGWEVIRNEMKAVKSGALITVDMNGATVVPGAVFDDIKGKDVTVAFDLGDGIRWSVNGMDITAGSVKDINLEVKVGADANNTIPVEIINSVSGERECVKVSLSYNGEFGFKATLTLKVDAENAGLFANLFYFNEQTKEMEFICADEIATDGTVELVFTHASEYAIVIDTVSMEAAAGADIPEAVSPAESDSATDGSLWWIVLVLAAVVIAGVVVYVVYSKKRESIEK